MLKAEYIVDLWISCICYNNTANR